MHWWIDDHSKKKQEETKTKNEKRKAEIREQKAITFCHIAFVFGEGGEA